MKKWFKRMLFWLLVVFVGIQVVPTERTNPPVDASQALHTPAPVEAILRESCYDCHSNETRRPWYAYVAPVSWWLNNHVQDGRRRLNFSAWSTLKPRPGRSAQIFGAPVTTTAQYQAVLLGRMEDDLMEGRMPLSSYLLMHSGARLTPEQNRILLDWCNATIEQLKAESAALPVH